MIEAIRFEGTIDPNVLRKIQLYPIFFPAAWRKLVVIEGEHRKVFSLSGIGNKIRMNHPGVFVSNLSDEALRGEIPWLYVIDKLDKLEDLNVLCIDWLLNHAERRKLSISAEFEDEIINTNLTYALPTTIMSGPMLAHIACHLFIQQKRRFSFKSNVFVGSIVKEDGKSHKVFEPKAMELELKFFINNQAGCAEAISQPIEYDRDYASLVYQFVHAYHPVTKEDRILIHPHYRRWMRGKRNQELKLKGDHSLYVLRKLGSQLSFHQFHLTANYGKPNFKYGEEELFNQLIRESITLDEILKTPLGWMNHDQYFIGIPYGENSFGGSHSIGSGVEQQMKKATKDMLEAQFSEWITVYPIPLLQKLETYSVETATALQEVDKKNNKLRRTVHFSHINYAGQPSVVNIVVGSRSRHLFDHALDVVTNSFIGAQHLGDGLFIFESANQRSVLVQFHYRDTHLLTIQMKDNSFDEESKRSQEIVEVIRQESWEGYTVYLLEIQNFHKAKVPKGDPYSILRRTFAQQGIKTQFIHPLNGKIESDRVRMEKALLDILTKAGFMIRMENMDFHLYGFECISLRGLKGKVELPVLSRITDQDISYHFLGNDGWYGVDRVVNYLQALKKQEVIHIPTWDEAQRRILDLLSAESTWKLLGIQCRIRYRYAPQFQNEKLTKYQFLLDNVKQLALVRYSTPEMWDVPSYYLFNTKKQETTKSSGIIQVDENLFLSVGRKPVTDKVGKYQTRFTDKKLKHQQRRLIELLVLNSQMERTNLEIAEIIHQSRDMTLTTDTQTNQAHPFYVIDSLKEYTK